MGGKEYETQHQEYNTLKTVTTLIKVETTCSSKAC